MKTKQIEFEVKPKVNKTRALKSVFFILNSTALMALSTFDRRNSQPCICSAYFVFDNKLNLYFWTDPNSLHSKNISNNPKVAAAIVDSGQKWGTFLKGVHLFGTAEIITNKELAVSGRLYLGRFPDASKFVKKIEDFHSEKYQSRIYKIQINKIKLLDEAVFGKEEFVEISFIRN